MRTEVKNHKQPENKTNALLCNSITDLRYMYIFKKKENKNGNKNTNTQTQSSTTRNSQRQTIQLAHKTGECMVYLPWPGVIVWRRSFVFRGEAGLAGVAGGAAAWRVVCPAVCTHGYANWHNHTYVFPLLLHWLHCYLLVPHALWGLLCTVTSRFKGAKTFNGTSLWSKNIPKIIKAYTSFCSL